MHIICHRGNQNGSNEKMENKPEYIDLALKNGFDVEVDVWLLSDGLYLGHDKPLYKINRYFLQNKKVWSHCKNIEAYLELVKYENINCFFQTEEEIVMTSRGFLWAHSKCKKYNNKTIITQLDNRNWGPPNNIYAVCSDYIINYTATNDNRLPFDLLIIDIDGVMTDGTKIYDREGKVFGKTYCDLDFTAIKRFKSAGINICFFSGDETVNKKMADSRKIDFFYNKPGNDKSDQLSFIKKYFNSNTVAYVGDDYYDIGIMNNVDYSFCPKNSFSAVKNAATKIIDVSAGKGVIAGLYDLFENKIPYVFPVDSADVNPK